MGREGGARAKPGNLLVYYTKIIHIRVLHGLGLGLWARGPAWASVGLRPGFNYMLRAGCGPETCRPGPGPVW